MGQQIEILQAEREGKTIKDTTKNDQHKETDEGHTDQIESELRTKVMHLEQQNKVLYQDNLELARDNKTILLDNKRLQSGPENYKGEARDEDKTNQIEELRTELFHLDEQNKVLCQDNGLLALDNQEVLLENKRLHSELVQLGSDKVLPLVEMNFELVY